MKLSNINEVVELIKQRDDLQDKIVCLKCNKTLKISLYDRQYPDEGNGFICTIDKEDEQYFIKEVVQNYLIQLKLKLALIDNKLQVL